MQALDSIFWLFFSFSFVLFGVFPGIPSAIAGIFGFMSASNFVFLYVIAVLVIRDFTRSIRLSKQEQRINALAQEIALREVSDKTEQPDDSRGVLLIQGEFLFAGCYCTSTQEVRGDGHAAVISAIRRT